MSIPHRLSLRPRAASGGMSSRCCCSATDLTARDSRDGPGCGDGKPKHVELITGIPEISSSIDHALEEGGAVLLLSCA